ncbi:hypothetical protein TVAG_352840 [Trichomonas vaginalis G3]|uniref:Uncharacterized protein n=1 Tax=Trichomonas vaginalis (strain ATCC PRA-98 / G3) TaxID=412133 RepID=A2EG86_TRIV3|nr:hypothetical protein TVAGG3_0134160 [Trichomonas vaginalis G3]EAY08362.1 hypothetical protein TVAG_352840 [Trichomonas vaginalis G3]KAI5546283.1 hypothetical protein TVAGG3_0134160 [Trichomonas vaginalis G3]|eukprot:XP_001320585.1 hypothetical protein [Trichomonas vaginalis G3]
MEVSNTTPAKALAIKKPEVTEEQFSGDEAILMSAESPKTEISDRDLGLESQTALRAGRKSTPREQRQDQPCPNG